MLVRTKHTKYERKSMLGILLNTRHRFTRGSGRLFMVDEAAAAHAREVDFS